MLVILSVEVIKLHEKTLWLSSCRPNNQTKPNHKQNTKQPPPKTRLIRHDPVFKGICKVVRCLTPFAMGFTQLCPRINPSLKNEWDRMLSSGTKEYVLGSFKSQCWVKGLSWLWLIEVPPSKRAYPTCSLWTVWIVMNVSQYTCRLDCHAACGKVGYLCQ